MEFRSTGYINYSVPPFEEETARLRHLSRKWELSSKIRQAAQIEIEKFQRNGILQSSHNTNKLPK